MAIRTIILKEDCALVPLTQGEHATIDLEDVSLIGQHNWCFSDGRYAARGCWQKRGSRTKLLHLHRVINDTPDGMQTDHINGDTLDSRRINLRTATSKQNQQNRSGDKQSSSKYKGVSWHKNTGKWRAYITVESKFKHLCLSHSEEVAAKTYDVHAKYHHGSYAKLNFREIGGLL